MDYFIGVALALRLNLWIVAGPLAGHGVFDAVMDIWW
jgi:hypothetical protein